MRALEVDDIHIHVEITTHPNCTSLPSTVTNSYILPSPSIETFLAPNSPPLSSGFSLCVDIGPPEALFYSMEPLSPDQNILVSSWLQQSVPFLHLRTLSDHLVLLLSESADMAFANILQSRISLVADATAVRASADATKMQHQTHHGDAGVLRMGELRKEKASITETIIGLDTKIAASLGRDEDTTHMLKQAQRQLKDDLRKVRAKMALHGEIDEGIQHGQTNDVVKDHPQSDKKIFVPDPPAYLMDEPESSTDESDLEKAVRDAATMRLGAQSDDYGGVALGYVSGETECSSDSNCEDGAGKLRSILSVGTKMKANFVIDLDASPRGSADRLVDFIGDWVAPKQGGVDFHENLPFIIEKKELWGVNKLRAEEGNDEYSDDTDDLEKSAAVHRGRRRERGKRASVFKEESPDEGGG